jgi:hypothetical protein
MKYLKIFEDFIIITKTIVTSNESTTPPIRGLDTYWELENGERLTINDVNNYLDEQGVEVEELDPKLFRDIIIDTKRDQNRVDSADLDFPIIVTKKDGEFTMVLDGQHRIVKCIQNGIETIKTRVLDLDTAPEKMKKIFK